MLDNFQKFLDYLKNHLKRLLSYLFFQLYKLYYRIFEKNHYKAYHLGRIFQDLNDAYHLELSFEDFKFSWRWTDHYTYTQEKELALKQLKPTLAPQEFISHALDECKKCNFLIFSSSIDDNLFLQFWLADGCIEFDFPMLPGNKLKPYKYQVMGLLAEKDYSRTHEHSKKVLKKKDPKSFILTPLNEGEQIIANFRETDEAAEFALTIIQNFFELEWAEVKIQVG